MSGLQLMVKSYTENPQYGDVRQFRAELDKTTHSVQVLESELYSLNNQLKEVSSKLPVSGLESPESYVCDRSDTTSQSSGYPSSASSGDVDSQFGETRDTDTCSTRDSQFGDTDSYRDAIHSLLVQSPGYYKPYPPPDTSLTSNHDEVVEEFPPPPDDMLGDDATDAGVGNYEVVTALYKFEILSEGNIRMDEGEELVRVGDDDGGWIRVRRTDGSEEGFVPTSFLNFTQ